ncbi:uncharacterized protein [Canis lupus baileyi]|uniref:uncharacterized protein LOC112648287 isoform X1 n=1 Tax=Canis lupus dingo TaxID=286419 RepID=UPI000DC6BF6A|nr:uncharacterized protein LOC112648287 isoform X1 [Canis lupus dingo]XP_038397908.1 uncharacterized protein LOC102154048 isoform X1 [Canis lupus familiaris]XP_038417470.1 uncharacterized protein LOC102154048 isoform X1 [Canis lupus familiaris]XP_038526741.1 uncharacterized protein LOC102154048 isoform X1 [Canis lupus familiaris]
MNLLRRPPHRRPLWERSRETILPRSVPRPVRTATGGQSGFPREMGRRRVGSGEGSPGTVALTLGTSAGPRNWITNGPGSLAGTFTSPRTAPVGAPGDAPGPGPPPHPSCGLVTALGNAEPAPLPTQECSDSCTCSLALSSSRMVVLRSPAHMEARRAYPAGPRQSKDRLWTRFSKLQASQSCRRRGSSARAQRRGRGPNTRR